jgi:release factor glutamine methyltransferase
MFVQSNTVRAVKVYFKERLADLFSEREIKQVFNQGLAKRLQLTDSALLLADELRLSESDLLYMRSIVKRLQQHEPLQYILGNTYFYGLQISCDKRALIPRPETEELVDWILTDVQEKGLNISNALDVCTGSGCIALALKSQLKEATVHALDFSAEALELTAENSQQLNLDIPAVHFDALRVPAEWPFESESFELWVSNPPYIPNRDKQFMAANVLDFEPGMALFVSDEDPLQFYRTIAAAAQTYLKKGAYLYFELHEDLAEQTAAMLGDAGWSDIVIRQDMQEKKRMLRAQKPA